MSHDDALKRIEENYPNWHTWTGVGGVLYARRVKSSPPVVYRATTPAGLEAQIREHERDSTDPQRFRRP
jgi:hypothetical protein